MKTLDSQPSQSQNRQAGFTIIESLVAIIVVAILMSAIAPAIVFSVATRVQARRVELATQAARSYLDGIRTGAIAAPPTVPTESKLTTTEYFLGKVSVPTSGSLNCPTANAYCTAPVGVYCVDLDGGGCTTDSFRDFVIQGFRSYLTATTDDPADGYRLGLRVYRADGFRDSGSLLKNDPTRVSQSPVTAGMGKRKAPLVEMTTQISTSGTSYRDLCTRLGGC